MMSMRVCRLTMIWVFLVLLVPTLAAPQATKDSTREKLSIERAVEIAFANHPDLRAAREREAAAQAGIGISRSQYFPQASFNGIGKLGLSGATNGLGLIGLPASPFYRNLSDAVSINQNIFDFGRTRHATAERRAGAQAATFDLQVMRIQVGMRAKESFLKVLSTRRAVQVREQSLRERQAVERKAREFYEAGLSSKLELNLARVGLSNAELALTEARNDERVAWAELFAALARSEGDDYELVEPESHLQEPVELSTEIEQALASRPDLKSLEAQIEAQRERVKVARSLRRPALRGVFSGGFARFAEYSASRLLVGGLGLFAPIYNGGELRLQVEQEEHNLQAIEALHAARVLQIRAELSVVHADLLKALESMRAYRQTAEYAEEALRLAQTRYRAQLTSFVELLATETAAEEARANNAQAIYSFLAARFRLDAATGIRP